MDAREHLHRAWEIEQTARTPAEYRAALHHARIGVSLAEPGSLLHTWGLHQLAAYAADLGFYAEAEQAACAFLEALPSHPDANSVAPYVYHALAKVRSRQGRHVEAIGLMQKALASAQPGAFQETSLLNLARFYARAGMPTQARSVLPKTVRYVPAGHHEAAKALICLKLGDYAGAQAAGRLAIRSYQAGEWRSFDIVLAAELMLTMRAAAVGLGLHQSAQAWLVHTAALLARVNEAVFSCLVRSLRGRGGDSLYAAAASHRGGVPADCARCALTGTYG